MTEPFRPSERLFGPTKPTLDPRLWIGDRLKPGYAADILGRLDAFWQPRYGNWREWARVYFAGSEATYWWGNNDLDTLIGVDYDRLKKVHPEFTPLDPQAISDHFNAEFRAGLNNPAYRLSSAITGTDETWDSTFYVNPNSWDIRRIKPYGAYDITNDRWVVRPPVTPPDWSWHQWPDRFWHLFDSIKRQIGYVLGLPEPYRKEQANSLWNFLHSDRSRAFGPLGQGWQDASNAIFKALDQDPSEPLTKLLQARAGRIATAATEWTVKHAERVHPEDEGEPPEDQWRQHLFTAHAGGRMIGHLDINSSPHDGAHIIDAVAVHPDWRRRGVAADLLRYAREQLGPVHHSERMTEAGAEWAAAVGGDRHGDPAEWTVEPGSDSDHLWRKGDKTAAAARRYFHLTFPSNRQSIQERGLRSARDEYPDEFEHLREHDYAGDADHVWFHGLEQPYTVGHSDTWELTHPHLYGLEQDDNSDTAAKPGTYFKLYRGTVAPEHLRLIHEGEGHGGEQGSPAGGSGHAAAKGRPRNQRRGPGQPAEPDGAGAEDSVGAGQEGPRPLSFHREVAKDIAKMHKRDQAQVQEGLDALAAGDPSLQTHKLGPPLGKGGWYATKTSRGHRIIHRPDGDGGIEVGYVGLHDYGKAINRLLGSKTALPEDYWMRHRPSGPEDDVGAPIHDLEQTMPDVYDHPEYYSSNHDPEWRRASADAVRQIRKARADPEADITIYRALPHPHRAIRTGDWVGLSGTYARIHGQRPDPADDWPVVKATVKAKHLWNEGDLHEFGYWGPHIEHAEIHFPGGANARHTAKTAALRNPYYDAQYSDPDHPANKQLAEMHPDEQHAVYAHPEDWFHGTAEPYHFTHVDPSQSIKHDSEDYEAPDPENTSDWNTKLGSHWAANHGVADDFGNRTIHAKLHIHRPKVYASEFDMDQEAYSHEYDAGNHPDTHWEDDDPMRDEQLDHRVDLRHANPPSYTGEPSEETKAMADYLGQPVPKADPHRLVPARFKQWLSRHPDHNGIAERHKQRLIAAGHDGVIYGNELEGPKGNKCAIAFHPHQVEITQMHESGEEQCKPREQAEHESERLPGAGQGELVSPGRHGEPWRYSAKLASANPWTSHPNLNHYRDGGMGGDEEHNVVGMVRLKALDRFKEHDGEWNGQGTTWDREQINRIRADLRSGHGLENPVQVMYDPRQHWAVVGEGHHRLRALEEEGHEYAPVRVNRTAGGEASKNDGVGGPPDVDPRPKFSREGYTYVPSDMHPQHLFRPQDMIYPAHQGKTAAAPPRPYPNPEVEGSHTWYHGTSVPFEHFEDEDENSAGDDGRNPLNKHWNTDMGLHFAAQRGVARTFAEGRGGYRSITHDSRIIHARLHMNNPKVYDSEHDMTRHAVDWAAKIMKHHWYPEHPDNMDEEGLDEAERNIGDRDMGEAMRETMHGIDQEGTQRGGVGDHEMWLGNHPDRDDVMWGFRQHLEAHGHDGIVYGNEYEGPKGNKCAIAFDPGHVHITGITHVHPEHPDTPPHDPHQPKLFNTHLTDGWSYPHAGKLARRIPPKPDWWTMPDENATDEERSAHWQRNRDAKQNWTRHVAVGIAMGHYHPDDAYRAGYSGLDGHEGQSLETHRWKSLPPVLWHVTTNHSAVSEHGLATRHDLAMGNGGHGLGGGTDDAISFTDNLPVAENIYHSLHEMHGALTGKLTNQQMWEKAKRGEGAHRPFHEDIARSIHGGYEPGDEDIPGRPIHEYLHGMKVGRGYGGGQPRMTTTEQAHREHGSQWNPVPGREPMGRAKDNGQPIHLEFQRPVTDDEARDRSYQMYKHFSFWRQQAGGREDPLFSSTDHAALAKADPSEFAIHRYQPIRGAMGYQLHALGEWRSPTGQNVRFETAGDTPHEPHTASWYDETPDGPRLNDEGRVSVADNVMEENGHTGETFEVPHNRGDWHADTQHPAARYVHEALIGEGYPEEAARRIRVYPSSWHTGQGAQAVTDGMNYIATKPTATAHTLLHEAAHVIHGTAESPEGHGPGFQATLHRLYRRHLGDEAADTFAGIMWPGKQASKADITATPAGTLANPYNGGDTWYHGSSDEVKDFSAGRPDVERTSGTGWPQPNKLIGTHFSPLYSVGHQFARMGHVTDERGWAVKDENGKYLKTPGNIHHVRLHMTNPMHFDDERHLDAAILDAARSHPDQRMVNGLQEGELPGYGDTTYEKLSKFADSPRGQTSEGRERLGRATQEWLTWHPHTPELVRHFVRTLHAAGHDGITYGNGVEGPHNHISAIATDPKTIELHKIDKVPYEYERHKDEAWTPDMTPRSEVEAQHESPEHLQTIEDYHRDAGWARQEPKKYSQPWHEWADAHKAKKEESHGQQVVGAAAE